MATLAVATPYNVRALLSYTVVAILAVAMNGSLLQYQQKILKKMYRRLGEI